MQKLQKSSAHFLPINTQNQQSTQFQFINKSPGMTTSSTSSSCISSPMSPLSPSSPTAYSDGADSSDPMSQSPPQCGGAGARRLQQPLRKSDSQPRVSLTDLRDFPSELADPARLLLTSCTDPKKSHLYSCSCSRQLGSAESSVASTSATTWAINFHHRHAFCTACGESAADTLPAKLFAEIFMSAALSYLEEANLQEHNLNTRNSHNGWWVGADSSCSLRFLSGSGADACDCSSESRRGYYDEEGGACSANSCVWAVNSVYSHAFCTRCGNSAEGPSLLSLLLAIRFGGKKMLSGRSGAGAGAVEGGSPKSCSGRRSNCSSRRRTMC